MSSVYHTEPPTKGKVVFQTSVGPIDVELWSKEAPKACRNFIQLALEGYYDRTTFHRVIPGFMAQGGDPTGTGEGGDSVWGKYFRDEVNARIRFNHRGQLTMANENRPDTNRAQFFFTLDACDWLNGKHTIFGTVAGDTVFNLLRMGEVETDDNDRPVDGITLKTVEVLMNPFDDVVPRISQKVAEVMAPTKPKPKGTKNLTLLSFGEEEAEAPSEQRMKPAPSQKVEKPLRPMLEQAESSSSSDDEEDRLRGAVKSAVARGGTQNARQFEKKGPTGAAGFAAKMAQKLKERRAAVAKREAVDKRKAVLSRVLGRGLPIRRRSARRRGGREGLTSTPSPRHRRRGRVCARAATLTLYKRRRSASATTPTTSTASSRRRMMWMKVFSSRRWRPSARKRDKRDGPWLARYGLRSRPRPRDRRKPL